MKKTLLVTLLATTMALSPSYTVTAFADEAEVVEETVDAVEEVEEVEEVGATKTIYHPAEYETVTVPAVTKEVYHEHGSYSKPGEGEENQREWKWKSYVICNTCNTRFEHEQDRRDHLADVKYTHGGYRGERIATDVLTGEDVPEGSVVYWYPGDTTTEVVTEAYTKKVLKKAAWTEVVTIPDPTPTPSKNNNSSKNNSSSGSSSTKTTTSTQVMYRLYNPNSGEHFYTASVGERNATVKAGWRYEGIGWTAPKKSNTPVYRLYNPNAGDHHYTTNVHEKNMLVSVGWKYEGIGWYSADTKTVPVYRQYNPNATTGAHNFTTSKGENNSLVNVGWRAEGIGWYAAK